MTTQERDETVALPAADEPWRRRAADVAAALGTDLRDGLSAAEAAARLGRYGLNELEPGEEVPAWRTFLRQFADPLVYLLFAAIAISLAVWALEGAAGIPFDAVVIALIVVVNALIGYTEEARAEEAVAALQRMAAPSAGVVRDGYEQRVPVADLVPGDVLLLAEGDAVGADARLAEAPTLVVLEASLTGESEGVLKSTAVLEGAPPLGDRVNMVFSGTAVTRGRGREIGRAHV